MALSLPLALRQAKNIFGEDSTWLMLLKVTLTDGTIFRLVPNNEDITFQTHLYTAFPVKVDFPKETSTGEIPSITFQLSNVTRIIQGHIEAVNGGIGSLVEMIIVSAEHLTEDYTELTMDFEVLSTTCAEDWVSIKCGASNPMRRRLLDKYFAMHCNWQFNSPAVRAANTGIGAECAYSGTDTTCNRTLSTCRAKSNAARFGGCPGLEVGGFRFA